MEDSRYELVRLTPALFDNALRLYTARPDKAYSMGDCLSMVVCRSRSISDVLTADRDFVREGFNAVFVRPGGGR